MATPPETGIPRAVTRVLSPAASPSTRRRVSARVGACLLLRRWDSTVKVVRRRIGLLSLRRTHPSPPYPPFGHFCAAVTFHSSSVFNSRDPDLVKPPTATSSVFSLPNCVVATSKIICHLQSSTAVTQIWYNHQQQHLQSSVFPIVSWLRAKLFAASSLP